MKSLKLSVLLLFPILCASCLERVDMGFPKKISFPQNGGIQIYTADRSLSTVAVSDYDGNESYLDIKHDEELICEFEWLKVEVQGDNDILVITAAPNPSGKRRVLYITCNRGIGPEYAQIKVRQD